MKITTDNGYSLMFDFQTWNWHIVTNLYKDGVSGNKFLRVINTSSYS